MLRRYKPEEQNQEHLAAAKKSMAKYRASLKPGDVDWVKECADALIKYFEDCAAEEAQKKAKKTAPKAKKPVRAASKKTVKRV